MGRVRLLLEGVLGAELLGMIPRVVPTEIVFVGIVTEKGTDRHSVLQQKGRNLDRGRGVAQGQPEGLLLQVPGRNERTLVLLRVVHSKCQWMPLRLLTML